jgi:D-sedoheptulose 7-phosphate isomerase
MNESQFEIYCRVVESNAAVLRGLSTIVDAAVALALSAITNGRKVIFCGNGGSAADSQHLAAELMGRFLIDRDPLPALALTVDTSALTAIGNDYGYDQVFARQLRGIGVAGDVLIGLSTSGNSRNVIAALEAAKVMGLGTIGLTGSKGGKMREICDIAVCVPSDETNHIQEMHIVVGHYLCGEIEKHGCRSPKA